MSAATPTNPRSTGILTPSAPNANAIGIPFADGTAPAVSTALATEVSHSTAWPGVIASLATNSTIANPKNAMSTLLCWASAGVAAPPDVSVTLSIPCGDATAIPWTMSGAAPAFCTVTLPAVSSATSLTKSPLTIGAEYTAAPSFCPPLGENESYLILFLRMR